MNPPFSRNQDMMHVQHAWKFVKPGGTLVAIMATGWTNNQNSTAEDFRKFTESVSDRVITPLERGIFDDTDVATVMLVLEKPLALAQAATRNTQTPLRRGFLFLLTSPEWSGQFRPL